MATIIAPNYTRAKNEALRLLQANGVDVPPVNPVVIAEASGLKVHFVTFSGTSTNISGFYDYEEQAIFVNKDEYPLRQSFTIAHELGHKILHDEWAKSSEYKVLLRDGPANGDPIEQEANSFAAHLLVPRYMLDHYWPELNESDLSRMFAVSVPVIKNRLAFEYGV
jgi:Zn-dependent peptidase ImmA (M78 family)